MIEHAIVALEAPETNWANLVRFVERSGLPVWLEVDGEVHGVLLPATQARRLMVTWAKEQDQVEAGKRERSVSEER